METTYETRYVGFVDILGFSALVQRSVRDASLLAVLRHGVWRLRNPATSIPPLARTNQFSDSIIVSAPAHADGLRETVQVILGIVGQLLMLGLPTRGAIVRGLCFHDEQAAFGPAIIEAYQRAEKDAIYPRIIVEDAVHREAAQCLLGPGRSLAQWFSLDACDGAIVLDSIRHSWRYTIVERAEDDWVPVEEGAWQEHLRELTEHHLSSTTDLHVRMKWEWVSRWMVRAFSPGVEP